MGRTRHAVINIVFGYIGTVATAVMSFILRTIFVLYLNDRLLGVNSLYTDILSLLSMAELGIGVALNYSLYKPVAEGNEQKIKGYLQMYRRAYRIIALVVLCLGLVLAPFLPVLVRNPGDITVRDLTLYYFIFLFNTVTSYFVAYKYSIVNAEQKNYIQTNILTITKVVSVFCQIIVLLLTKNFYAYLLTDAAVQLAQKFVVSRYLDARYPVLTQKDVTPLTKEETNEVWKKTRALLLHKIGDVARLQTDTLIISALIEVAIAGRVSNYTLVISTLSSFANIIFNSVISSIGNLVATESKEKQYEVFRTYRFLAQWVYGLTFIGFFLLLSDFVELWLGETYRLPAAAVGLLLIDYYFKGDRIVLSNFKTAAGIFEEDKYLALIQGAVNLVVSIVMVHIIGLAGVYVGTIVSGLIANVTKPFILYRKSFDRPASEYFRESFGYLAVVVLALLACAVMQGIIYGGWHALIGGLPISAAGGAGIRSFVLTFFAVILIFHAVFLGVYRRSASFASLLDILRLRKSRNG